MRVLLGGYGDPIPESAMPDAYIDPDFPIQTIVLEDGEDFDAGTYLALGYTNFEVWCVGAAGGYGSLAFHDYDWPYYVVGSVQHWHDPVPFIKIGWGGAPGGGGLHHVEGLLSALPSLVPVVVGVAGADGRALTDVDLTAPAIATPPDPWPDPDYVYDLPQDTWYPPEDGSDGGASSFGGTVCRASGGKGGEKPAVGAARAFAAQYTRNWLGNGGAGGVGGTTTAGGGAAGGTAAAESPGTGQTVSAEAPAGSWDGTIGQGGGGGAGGVYIPDDPFTFGTYQLYRHAAGGGRGSYSFGDTSVFGERQPKQNVTLPIWPNSPTNTSKPVSPGAGGGAKPVAGVKAGSRATGYSPDGTVIVRIAKLV